MPRIFATDLEEAATAAAGNWQKFQCFVWWREKEVEEPEKWAIIYTHNRDSGLLAESNASVYAKALRKFAGRDVVFERHDHWAVGHVDGFSIRVFTKRCHQPVRPGHTCKRGDVTAAFRTYWELACREEDYPILDESDYSNRETEATYNNLKEAARGVRDEYVLPEDWQDAVYEWLSEHRCSALESTSDQGGWPKKEDFVAAFTALGYPQAPA